MSDSIHFDGVRFLSAAEAADLTGLTRDYVGRLCRQGWVRGHQLGNRWYVDLGSLRAFRAAMGVKKVALGTASASPMTVRPHAHLTRVLREREEARRVVSPAVSASALVPHAIAALFITTACAVAAYSVMNPQTSRVVIQTMRGDPHALVAATASGASRLDAISGRVYRWLCPLFDDRCGTVVYMADDTAPRASAAESPTIAAAPVVASSTHTTVINNNHPIVERVIERTVERVSPSDDGALTARLQTIENTFSSRIAALSGSVQHVYTPVATFAQATRIDSLSGVSLSGSAWTGGTITDASISGGSVAASALLGAVSIAQGGTGTTTTPSYGQLLLGNAQGGYDLVATSSLGIAGGGGGTWGSITGTLSNQTDLQSALDGKLSLTTWYATTTTALAEGANLYFTSARATSTFIQNLAATTSVASLTTLPNLSLPYAQLTGAPTSMASSTLLTDSNTWSGANAFQNITATGATSTTFAITGVTSALHLANGTGGVTAYTGTSCTNQFVRSVNGAGVATCASVSLATDVTGTLAVSNGGTGTTTAPAGWLLYGGGSGAYQAIATTSVSCAGSVSCSGFTTLGSSPITITGSGGGSWPFTPTTNFGQDVQSTTTALWLNASGYSLFASSSVQFGTAGGSQFLWDSTTSRLGIGTTTPWKLLSIAGDMAANHILPNGPYTTNLSGYDLGATGSRWNALWAGTLNVGTSTFSIKSDSASNLGFFTAASGGGTQALTLASSGNVGIGTTSPAALLSVHGNAYLGSSGSSILTLHAGQVNFPSAATTTVLNNSPYAWTIATTTTANPLFRIDTTSGSEQVSIGMAGSDVVLGGTNASPNLVFQNNGSIMGAGAGKTITIGQNGDIINFGVNVGVASSSPWARFSLDTTSLGSGIPSFAVGSSTRTDLIVTQAGNVGVGTTSPWRTLSLVGSLAVNGLSTSATGNYVCINTTTWEVTRGNGSACTTSSIRFKENIAGLPYGLETISAMHPVVFNYKQELHMGTSTHVGFIAEEMFPLIPEVVNIESDGTVGGIDYPSLTAVLARGIQEVAAISGVFKERLIAWMADASNGIGEIFARVFNASEKICVDGECLTKDDIRALKQMAGAGAAITSPTPLAPEPVPEPSPSTTDPAPAPAPTMEPVPGTSPEPSPEPIPEAPPAPQPESSL